MAEIVVIAVDEAAAARCAHQLGGAQTQGRVVITAAAASAVPGQRVFTADRPPGPGDLVGLSAAKRLFVDAWRLRLGAPPKERPGDGLTWDTPGFEPPDPAGRDDD